MCQADPPAPPDYTGAAVAQGAANADAARVAAKLSNPNVIGPLGTQTVQYGANGGDPDIPTITQTLTPDAQATLQSQQAVQKNLANLGLQGIDTAKNVLGSAFNPNLPGIKTNILDAAQPQGAGMGGPGNFGPGTFGPESMSSGGGSALSGVGNINGGPNAGLYGMTRTPDLSGVAAMPVNAGTTGQQAIMSRLQPALERNRQLQETSLRNQGLVAGGEAYDAAQKDLGQQENDLYTQAALQGINLDLAANNQGFAEAMQQAAFGNQATGQDFGQALQSAQQQNAAQAQNYNQLLQNAQFGNTAQQQALQQQLALRNQPLNEIAGLMSGSQIQLPQFQGYQGSNVAPTPVLAAQQAQGANAMQNFGIQQAGLNANTSGLYGLGGMGLMGYLAK